MQYIGKLDKNKLGEYGNKLITDEVILNDERLEHILTYHKPEYGQIHKYIKDIILSPNFIIVDNRHEDTMIYLKKIKDIGKSSRIVVKLALGKDDVHNKNEKILDKNE